MSCGRHIPISLCILLSCEPALTQPCPPARLLQITNHLPLIDFRKLQGIHKRFLFCCKAIKLY